jgi:TRAP-type uncharacterized transport system fused permease subunit
MRTGFAATRFGWTAFIVPVLFVFSPTLLLIGSTTAVVIAFVTAAIGVFLISVAVVGHYLRPLNPAMRALFALAGLAALTPAEMFPGGTLVDVLGVIGGLALVANEYLVHTRRRAALAAKPSGGAIT